ncbi:hypothetical protein ACIBUY_04720 [Streptomyces sp. NPDC050085]|uniref:hypothetical protein n=1 Tax=Streptomyces sp. NPDC050085 TaxID=3365600 RepID=UPI00379EFBEE
MHRLPGFRLTTAVCALTAALALAGPVTGQPVRADDTPQGEWYQTEVEFGDGSALITRLDTGGMRTTPARGGGMPSEAQQAIEDGSITTTRSLAPEARTDTPNGYTLHGNHRTDRYHYRSDEGLAKLDRCQNGECTVKASVKVQLKQTLHGGSSHRWTLGLHTRHWTGDAYSFSYDYYCGVNVPRASDWTCETKDATADGHHFAAPVHASTGTYNHDLNRDFGAHETSRTKFPMVAYHVSWPGYPAVVNVKYRGWDIRRYAGVWKLAPASGTGR